MLAQESGRWQVVSELAKQLHLSEIEVAENYWQAMQWARNITGK
jgi:c-di-GMP-related signal transduction protein